MHTTKLLALCLLATSLMLGCEDKKKVDGQAPATETAATNDAKNGEAAEETEEKADDEAAAEDESEEANAQKADGEEYKGGKVEAAEGGGKWVVSSTYNVKFRVPEDWGVAIEEDGVSATDSDETTTVVLVGSESHNMIQSALQDVQKKVRFKDAKIDSTKQTVLNGFAGQNVRGTAVLTPEGEEAIDQEIQFIAYNIRINKDTVVTMMLFSEAEMYEAKKETIEGLAKTLTKS